MINMYLIVDSILESVKCKALKKSILFFNKTISGFCMGFFQNIFSPPRWIDGSHVWVSVFLAIVIVEIFIKDPEMLYQLWATRGGENIGGQIPGLFVL